MKTSNEAKEYTPMQDLPYVLLFLAWGATLFLFHHLHILALAGLRGVILASVEEGLRQLGSQEFVQDHSGQARVGRDDG